MFTYFFTHSFSCIRCITLFLFIIITHTNCTLLKIIIWPGILFGHLVDALTIQQATEKRSRLCWLKKKMYHTDHHVLINIHSDKINDNKHIKQRQSTHNSHSKATFLAIFRVIRSCRNNWLCSHYGIIILQTTFAGIFQESGTESDQVILPANCPSQIRPRPVKIPSQIWLQ